MTSVTPELLKDDFWETAFQADDPFPNELKTEFRRGLLTGNEDDLRWGRLAIASITDRALWPLLSRLTQLAADLPRAEFVESLVFFLSDENTLQRLRNASTLPSVEQARQLENLANTLCEELVTRNDMDLANDLEPFRELLHGISQANDQRS